MPDLYRDRSITCTDSEVIVRGYYFPVGGAKWIPYRRIKNVSRHRMGRLTGQLRIWGTSTPSLWAHYDLRRPTKDAALVLDLGSRVRPFLTPDDPERVAAIIEAQIGSAG